MKTLLSLIICIVLSMTVQGCSGSNKRPEPDVTINLVSEHPEKVDQRKVKRLFNYFYKTLCPESDITAIENVKITHYSEPFMYQKEDYGWNGPIYYLEVSLRQDVEGSKLPAYSKVDDLPFKENAVFGSQKEYIQRRLKALGGVTLHYIVGSGKKPGMFIQKRSSRYFCGYFPADTSQDFFVADDNVKSFF